MAEESAELVAFRAEARTWLQENFPQSLSGNGLAVLGGGDGSNSLEGDALKWRKRLGEKGWGTPTWPSEYGGGGLTHLQARVLQEEMNAVGAVNPIAALAGMGVTMVGPTILEYGTEDQKQRHIPPLCRGEIRWCVGYSEPNAGSDLASLSTKTRIPVCQDSFQDLIPRVYWNLFHPVRRCWTRSGLRSCGNTLRLIGEIGVRFGDDRVDGFTSAFVRNAEVFK